jgi:hypothetical protein
VKVFPAWAPGIHDAIDAENGSLPKICTLRENVQKPPHTSCPLQWLSAFELGFKKCKWLCTTFRNFSLLL